MKALRKPLSLFMALLMCLGVFRRDRNYGFCRRRKHDDVYDRPAPCQRPQQGRLGHPALNFLGGWSTGENDSFSVHTQDAFNGQGHLLH